MSQKKKVFLNVKGDCDADCSVVEPSPEKRKIPNNGLRRAKEPKTKRPCQRVNTPEKKHQWVLSSFDGFEYSNSQAVPTNNSQKSQPRSKQKSSEANKPRIKIDNNDLWCDKHSPLTEAVLAVHKKKVSEVRDWLLSHLCLQSGNGVLLLTGPPGSGKTATLRVLAKELDVEIQEWVNPLAQSFDNDFNNSEWKNYEGMIHRQSQVKNFQDFFLRANKYPCLPLGVSDAEQNKKIILVEDLPNVFYRRASELHDILRSYQKCSRNPVVFIVSDSNSNDTNAYRLFPKDIIQSLGIAHISFNPASMTSLNKLAKEIIWSESKKKSSSFQTPSAEVIDALVSGCNGDIRGLINNLQFTCLKGCSMTFQKMKHTKQLRASREKSGKRSSKKPTAETESSSSSTIGGKDTSLFLFRVLGKVLYCKREENSNQAENSLPAHLKQHERLPLVENPESIFERSHMSGENVNLYLHQNYLDFFNNIDDLCVASEYFSDADHLTAEWMHRTTLCCYTPCVAIRGLMFCNKGKTVNQTKNVWRPLHKPKWFDVFKQTRQNNSTAIDLFKGHSRNSEQLHCEYLPYLALSDTPLSSPGQINYLQTVCKFSRNACIFRGNDSTLQEKEMNDSEGEISSSQPQSSQGKQVDDKEILHVTHIEADDDIEEFDDD